MDIDRPAAGDLLANRAQNTRHVLALAWNAQVPDGVANVPHLDAALGGHGSQQIVILRRAFADLGEVDEGANSGVEELRQLVASVLVFVRTRVLAGEQHVVYEPVARRDRSTTSHVRFFRHKVILFERDVCAAELWRPEQKASRKRVTTLEQLPARIDDLTSQISQLRTQMRAEFSAVRAEMATGFAAVRSEVAAEVAEKTDSLATRMLVLHQDVIAPIALLQEGLSRPPTRKPRRK